MFRRPVVPFLKPASAAATTLADSATSIVDGTGGADADGWTDEVAAGGVVAAFSDLADELYRYFYARTGSAQDADDLVMELFVQAWRYRDAVTQPEAWLRRVAMRIANRFLRRPQFHAPLADDAVVDPGTGSLDDVERRWAVMAAFHMLGEDDRLVVLVHGLEKRPIAEVAQILGISVDAAWQRWQRARKKLAQLLRDEGMTLPG